MLLTAKFSVDLSSNSRWGKPWSLTDSCSRYNQYIFPLTFLVKNERTVNTLSRSVALSWVSDFTRKLQSTANFCRCYKVPLALRSCHLIKLDKVDQEGTGCSLRKGTKCTWSSIKREWNTSIDVTYITTMREMQIVDIKFQRLCVWERERERERERGRERGNFSKQALVRFAWLLSDYHFHIQRQLEYSLCNSYQCFVVLCTRSENLKWLYTNMYYLLRLNLLTKLFASNAKVNKRWKLMWLKGTLFYVLTIFEPNGKIKKI